MKEIEDEDLNSMSKEDLISEVKKLRDGIREHRDTSAHDLCWHHPKLWSLLPEKTDPIPTPYPIGLNSCVDASIIASHWKKPTFQEQTRSTTIKRVHYLKTQKNRKITNQIIYPPQSLLQGTLRLEL
jgi:hypothetical protein